MSFSFFVPLLTYPDPTPRSQFGRALDLAATLQGKIHAAVVEVDVPPVTDPMLTLVTQTAEIAEQAEAASRQMAAELSAAVQRQAERLALPISVETVRTRVEYAGRRLAEVARTHDYSLLCLSDSDDHRDLAESVLFESGGPAILFPDEGPAHLEAVGIAWDNSRAASRALRDALPILTLAARVIIFSATFDKQIDTKSIAKAQAFLEQHGVIAEAKTVATSSDLSLADSLQDAALANDCGLLVMGAFGHSRLREFILGGATRSILRARKLPILMSH